MGRRQREGGISDRAGIADLQPHDLRRAVGQAETGANLLVIERSLSQIDSDNGDLCASLDGTRPKLDGDGGGDASGGRIGPRESSGRRVLKYRAKVVMVGGLPPKRIHRAPPRSLQCD